MASQRTTFGHWFARNQDLARVLLVMAAIIVVMLVLTAVFGLQRTGPSYDIVTDPAGLGLF